ncbi:MAG: DUF1385 domain-containing protein [Oscillospiraceae bacterium]|nr:DUF1385 domain-containing protein [Oscillospiraceae bacterium]
MSKKKNISETQHKTSIGGQALTEGIMMRGPGLASMACRLPDGTVDIETWEIKTGKNAPWYMKAPFIRGCINFGVAFVDGIKCNMKASEKQITDDDDDEEPTAFEKWLTEKLGDKLVPVIMIAATVIGVVIAVCLFKFLPMLLSNLLEGFGVGRIGISASEGVLKILLLVGYMWAISFMPDIATTFRYHGAEHKTIACYEKGLPLTVENIREQTRFHPRCGTSFLLIVVLINILVNMFLPYGKGNMLLRFGLQMLLLAPIASISYEIIRIAGRYDNAFTRFISAPGLWLQRITTKEPNDKQIEVAIAAMEKVIPENREDDRW